MKRRTAANFAGWRVAARFILISLLASISGCARDFSASESALKPAGPQAAKLGALTWLFIWVCLAVFILIMITLAGALLHRRRGETMGPSREPITEPEPSSERRTWRTVSWATLITVVVLFGLLIADFVTGRDIHQLSTRPNPLRIKVIGHQWWWEIRYIDWPERFGERLPYNQIVTANEIHIPVDPQNPVAVELQLESHDVIHSFWAPNLHGKRDLVPGHPTSLWIQADTPGDYWGECAEYCGYQHAQMRFLVVAQPVDEFKTWLEAQRKESPEPANDWQTRGRNVFLNGTCAMCHAIAGTEARGNVGPDLTHVASRKLLAAGAVPNVPGHLAGWIIDPQQIKPGVRMPQNNLHPHDLRALLEYLETLK